VFALIHGGAHGAWCWTRLIRALAALGHRCVAVDLPCEDDAAGVDAYARAIIDAVAGIDAPIVVVGHSLGGITAPVVAERHPVRRLIFLAAMLPVPGMSLNEQRAERDMLLPYSGGTRGLRGRFYNTCTPQDADWAMGMLRRQSLSPFEEKTPLGAWPDVPSSYILCSEDRACDPAWSRAAAPDRLGVEPIEMRGTGHSPFLDRPDELAAILVQEAAS
jgi:pimeloyl-ACP methyl ester carboxylesterase